MIIACKLRDTWTMVRALHTRRQWSDWEHRPLCMGVCFGKQLEWVESNGMAQEICTRRSNMGGRGGADEQRRTFVFAVKQQGSTLSLRL